MELLKKIFFFIIIFLSFDIHAINSMSEKKIGVILLSREHKFFRDLEDGLINEAKKYDLKLLIVYSEFDIEMQYSQIDDMISKKIDALILAPCNSNEIGDAILKLNKYKIPVFTVDIANLSGKGNVVSHIASDNIEGGIQAGKLMVEALKGKGKVVIISHPKVASVSDRIKGFRDYILGHPGIEIVAEIPGWGQRSRSMAIMEDFLLMMPDINGVFGINDDSALGALKAIEASGKSNKIEIVGYDATTEAKKVIESGKIYGDVVQYPQEMANLTIKAIIDYFEGRPVKPYIPVKIGIFTKELNHN